MTPTIRPKDLDTVFEALGNQHRREIVYALGLQPHSITQLADMRDLSLPAIHKHIKILENAGLVTSRKLGRTHVLTLNRESMRRLQTWLMQFQAHWGTDQETLDNYGEYLKKNSKEQGML